jgi:UPF0755 protein
MDAVGGPAPRRGPRPGQRGPGQRGPGGLGGPGGQRGPGGPGPGGPGPGAGPRPGPGSRGWDDDSFLPGFGDEGYDEGYEDGFSGDQGEFAGQGAAVGQTADPGGRGGDGGRDGDDGDGTRPPKRARGPIRRLAPWIAIVVVLLVIGIPGYYAYHLYMNKYHPADFAGPGTGSVTVQIPPGASASSIAPELTSDGVIASDRALVLAAEHSTNTAGLEPGTYKLKKQMSAAAAYAALLNPKNRVQLLFTLREGQRVAQVIAAVAKLMNVPVSQFESIVNNPPASLGLPSYAVKSVSGVGSDVIGYKVEGFLWPATYTITPHETPLQVLQAMVKQYNTVAQQQNFAAEAKARNLSVFQLLDEASIVQAEAGNQPQMPKIARVIENRFNNNMALQFDSILEYGQNTFSVNIQDSQATIPGPYNDFQHQGLPPTPISNPGLDAINAVLHPATGNWLYFLAQPNGSSIFCLNQPASATATSCPAGG